MMVRHRLIYICGEAATFIPHLSRAFIYNQGALRPVANPEV